MIQEYQKSGKILYRIRVHMRSSSNPNLRISRQVGDIASLAEAKRDEVKMKKECERELHQIEARGILWGDLVYEWNEHALKTKVATGERSKVSQEDYVGSLKKWFGKYENRPVLDLNPLNILTIFDEMKSQEKTYGYRKKTKAVLKAVFDYGIQSGLVKGLAKSPTIDVVLRRGEEKKPEILTIQQIQRLVHLAYITSHKWRRVWATALLTGMRSGELFALTWQDIDFENKLINVNKSFNKRFNTTKSTKNNCWRQVPISEDLEKVLREQGVETENAGHVFPRYWEWMQGNQAMVLRSFCLLHGLPSIRFHTLRACFATHMLRTGIEPAKVMKVCGWKELKTMQVYVRLAGIEIQNLTEAIKIMPSFEIPQVVKVASNGEPIAEESGESGIHPPLSNVIAIRRNSGV